MSDDVTIPNPGYTQAGYRGRRAGRYSRARSGMTLDTRRLMLFAGGLGGILICLIGASTLVGHRDGAVPVVTADNRPIRVRPENPGGMQIDGAENDVFSGGINDANARLAPGAEAPDPNGLRASAQAAAVPIPPPAALAAQADTVVVTPPPAPPAAARLVAAVVPPANATPISIGPRPAGGHQPAGNPVAANPGETTAVAASHPQPASAEHAATVQLAALTTEQAAHEEWQLLSRRMPDLLGGRQPNISRIERGGHTFWRLRMAGFPDVTQAKTFCEQVRSKGGACSVADF